MAFTTQRNSISFGRPPAAIKAWVIGWTVDAARTALQPPNRGADRRPTGAFRSLYAGIARR